jgi:hypothetical protein
VFKIKTGDASGVRQQGMGLAVHEVLHMTAFIDEVAGRHFVSRSAESSIAKTAEQQILQQCLAAVAHANATRTDPFGYARAIQWFHPYREFAPIDAVLRCRVTLKGEGMIR